MSKREEVTVRILDIRLTALLHHTRHLGTRCQRTSRKKSDKTRRCPMAISVKNFLICQRGEPVSEAAVN